MRDRGKVEAPDFPQPHAGEKSASCDPTAASRSRATRAARANILTVTTSAAA
jgi:hypothetical protein